MDSHTRSPSIQYEDAPHSLPRLSELSESPIQEGEFLTGGGQENFDSELQPSPPQSPTGKLSGAENVNGHGTSNNSNSQISQSFSASSASPLPILDVSSDSSMNLEDGEITDERLTPIARNFSLPSSASSPHVHLPIAAAVGAPIAAPVMSPSLPPVKEPVAVDQSIADRQAKRAAWARVQSNRSQSLAAEIDSMTKLNSRDEQFWSLQERRHQALINRAEAANKTTSEMLRYFDKSSRAVNRVWEELREPLTLGGAESGTLKDALTAVEGLRNVIAEGIGEVKEKHTINIVNHVSSKRKFNHNITLFIALIN